MSACQMNDDHQIAAESRQIFKFAKFSNLHSEVTAPIFTKISHDVEALGLV